MLSPRNGEAPLRLKDGTEINREINEETITDVKQTERSRRSETETSLNKEMGNSQITDENRHFLHGWGCGVAAVGLWSRNNMEAALPNTWIN